MKHIQFLGAAGMVTGSSYLLSDDSGTNILVDMGAFQGTAEETKYNDAPLSFSPRSLSAVVLTHAHLDHCGRLPLLVKHGFVGRIYMTPATRELLEITLVDSADIAKSESRSTKRPVTFDQGDVKGVLQSAVTVEYHQSFDINRFSGVFIDAGHILGSASVVLTDNSRSDATHTIVFGGDLGNTPQDLIRPTEYIDSADAVIMESTYGDREHPSEDPKRILAKEIDTIEKNDGTLLIPAFSIERTQVLLHMIGHMKEDGMISRSLNVFLDSPMGGKITEVYRTFPDLYNEELAQHAGKHDPFDFQGLSVIEEYSQSLHIRTMKGPKVIIAGSGMMSGGRIMSHAAFYLPLSTTRLLFVGYQGVDTIGRLIQEGARSVVISGKTVQISASVNEMQALSAHADQPRLLNWLKHIHGVQTVFLTHGDDGPREALAEKIRVELGIPLVVRPKMKEEFQLDLLPSDI